MASIFRKLFKRKKQPPLVCAVAIDENTGHPIGEDPNHVHTAACFIDFEPLAVVELFQSQGCQSCPPALPAIHEATAHPNLALLTYDVTLFDHLGWKDSFASSANDARQRAYAKAWGRNSLFTPQLVVNGMADGSGAAGKEEVQGIVARGRAGQKAMDWHIFVDANDTEVQIDSDKQEASPHDVLVIVYQSVDQQVKPAKGPNKGKKINHRNIVQGVNKIGQWTGGNLTIPLPMARSQMNAGTDAIVVVQEGPGGPIVGAAKI